MNEHFNIFQKQKQKQTEIVTHLATRDSPTEEQLACDETWKLSFQGSLGGDDDNAHDDGDDDDDNNDDDEDNHDYYDDDDDDHAHDDDADDLEAFSGDFRFSWSESARFFSSPSPTLIWCFSLPQSEPWST